MYRISMTDAGEKRWWRPDETIPAEHCWRREATAEEAAKIDEILAVNDTFGGAHRVAAKVATS